MRLALWFLWLLLAPVGFIASLRNRRARGPTELRCWRCRARRWACNTSLATARLAVHVGEPFIVHYTCRSHRVLQLLRARKTTTFTVVRPARRSP